LQRLDERLPTLRARERAKIIGAQNDDLFPAVNGDVLGTLLFRESDDFAESRFGVLQLPPAGTRGA